MAATTTILDDSRRYQPTSAIVPATGGLDLAMPGDQVCIVSVDDEMPRRVRSRILALGFVPGTIVSVVRKAPLGDPIEYELRGGRISLRRSEAQHIRTSS